MSELSLHWTRMPDASWSVQVRGGRRPHVLFTTVRPLRGPNGLVNESAGWIVGGRGFDTMCTVASFEEAKVRVEALFAMEYDSLAG